MIGLGLSYCICHWTTFLATNRARVCIYYFHYFKINADLCYQYHYQLLFFWNEI